MQYALRPKPEGAKFSQGFLLRCHCEEAHQADAGPTSTVGSAERTFLMRSAAIRIPAQRAAEGSGPYGHTGFSPIAPHTFG